MSCPPSPRRQPRRALLLVLLRLPLVLVLPLAFATWADGDGGCSVDGGLRLPGVGEAVCGATDWRTVHLDSFEAAGTGGWSDGSRLVCGRFGPVLELEAPAEATAATAATASRVFALEEPHATVLVTLDVLAPQGWDADGGVELTLAAGEPGAPAVVWSSVAVGGGLPAAWSPSGPRLPAACSAGATGAVTRVAATLVHTGSVLELRVALTAEAGGLSVGVDNVRVAVPAAAAVGEVGELASVGGEPVAVRLRGDYARPPVVIVGAPSALAAGMAARAVVLAHDGTREDASPAASCEALSGAVAGRFKSCGGACVPRQSCWDDVDGCEALLPEGKYESCGGRCVPRGGCGWSFEVFLQTCGGEAATDAATALPWLAIEPGVHWSATEPLFALQAGSAEVTSIAFTRVEFDQAVPTAAGSDRSVAVLSSLQTLSSGNVYLGARHSDSSSSGFSAALQGAERLELRLDGTVNNGLPRRDETLGWVAVTEGHNVGLGAATFEAMVVSLSSNSAEVPFRSAFVQPAVFASVMELRGLDSVNVKKVAPTSSSDVTLKLDEDSCQDAEVEHAIELVGIILVGFDPTRSVELSSSLSYHLQASRTQASALGESCVCRDEDDAVAASSVYSTCDDARSTLAEHRLGCTEAVGPGNVALSTLCPVTCALCGPDTNIALTKPVVSDSSADGFTADKAVDGCINSDSRWVSSYEEAEHWLTVDLLDVSSVRAVVVHEDVDQTSGNCQIALEIFEAAAASWRTVGTATTSAADAGPDECAALSTAGQLQVCEGACVPRHSCWDLNGAAVGSRSVTFANINLDASLVRVRVDASSCEEEADRHARIHDVSVHGLCPLGHVAAGTTDCVQVNPCDDAILAQVGLCDSNSQCAHAGPGRFVCACKDGWERQRFVASEVDAATEPDECGALSGAVAGRFKSCGGACVPRQSCWDDVDGCEALLPEGKYESCGGRCVPRGGCGWSFEDPCVDVAPPVLECPQAFSAVAARGSAFATVRVPLPTVSDDSSFELQFSHVNGTLVPHVDATTPADEVALRIGINVVGWRATDSQGNHATCYLGVTVLDLEPPQIGLCGVAVSVTAPRGRLQATLDFTSYGQNIELADNSEGLVTLEAWMEPSSASDESCSVLGSARLTSCYGSCIPNQCLRGEPVFSTSPLSVGNHSLAIQAVDPSGNTGELCSIQATIEDFDECQDPATPNGDCWAGLVCTNMPGRAECSECPAGLFGNRWPRQCHLQDPCDEGLAALWPGEFVAQHQCDPFAICARRGIGVSSFGQYTCTCRAGFVGSGFVGDCVDEEAPSIRCVSNLTVATAPGRAIAAVVLGPFPDVSDNAGEDAVVTAIQVNQSGIVTERLAGMQLEFALGVPSNIMYIASDDAGNEGICVTDVLVIDTEPPTMTCPNTTVLAGAWQHYADVLVEPVGVEDNSGDAVSLSVLLPQNISVEQNISINENETVLMNVSISLVDMQVDHRMTTMRLQSGETHLFVWTALTADGLSSQCTTQVHVQDTDECTDASTADNGGCSQLRECLDTVGGRECDPCPAGWISHVNRSDTDCASVNPCVPSDNPCDVDAGCSHVGPGVHLCACHVGYTGNGSAGFCSDISPPTIRCAEDWTVQTDPGNNTSTQELPTVTAYDSATGQLPVSWNFTNSSMLLHQPENTTVEGTARLRLGKTALEYVAVDEAGNRASCTWSVLVVDAEAPVLGNCTDVSIVAPPFEHTGHPFLSPGLRVEVWSPGELPYPPIEASSLGAALITTQWANINQSATLTAFPGFQARRDRFVALWTGYIDISHDGAGEYSFSLTTADGDRAALIIGGSHTEQGVPTLLTGPMVEVELQYVETVGLAQVIFQWQRPGQPELEVVPEQVLHHTVLRGWPTLVEDNSQMDVSLHIEDDTGATLGIPAAFGFGHRMLRIVGTDYAGNHANCQINVTIQDRDECATHNGGCDEVAVCTNQMGSRLCSACPLGFEGNGYNGCTLIDQCRNTTGVVHNCTAVAACHLDSPGAYSCHCPAGYEGDGFEIDPDRIHTGCTDIASPILECPSAIVVQAWPDATRASVTLEMQEASDNSGAPPSVTATRVYDTVATSVAIGDPQLFQVGTSTVRVVAQDAQQNTAACTVDVEVQPVVSVAVPTRMHYLFEGRDTSVVVYSYHLGSAPASNLTVVEVLARPAGIAQTFLYLDSPRATFTSANWSTPGEATVERPVRAYPAVRSMHTDPWCLLAVMMRVRVFDNMVDEGDKYFAEIYHTTSSADIVSSFPLIEL